MNSQTRIFASSMFVLVAIVLMVSTGVPSRAGLKQETGKITQIISKPATWYEVEIITASGVRLSCKTKRENYSLRSKMCPLELLELNQGKTVEVQYKKTTPYQLSLNKQFIIDYSAFKKMQMLGVLGAVLMLFMAAGVWKIK